MEQFLSAQAPRSMRSAEKISATQMLMLFRERALPQVIIVRFQACIQTVLRPILLLTLLTYQALQAYAIQWKMDGLLISITPMEKTFSIILSKAPTTLH